MENGLTNDESRSIVRFIKATKEQNLEERAEYYLIEVGWMPDDYKNSITDFDELGEIGAVIEMLREFSKIEVARNNK